MRDTIDILRGGDMGDTQVCLAEADSQTYFHNVVAGSCMALGVVLDPGVRSWLGRTLAEFAQSEGLSTLGKGEALVDMMRNASTKGDVVALANTGKTALMAAGGLGARPKSATRSYYIRTAQAALKRAGQIAPFLDYEPEEEDLPPQGLVVGPSDEKEFKYEIQRWTQPVVKAPILVRAAFQVPAMARIVRMVRNLCVMGDRGSAIEMSGEPAMLGSSGIIH